MTLSPQWLDELRQRTTLSALISPAVRLQRAGREQKGCCPFHDEKSPSFYVNDDKHFYHCFGCSAHGDAIRWMTDYRGMSFMDAVKDLAQAAGMEVPQQERGSASPADDRAPIYALLERATGWFASQLVGESGKEARTYAARREISADQQKRFRVGYAPGSRRGEQSAFRKAFADVDTGMLVRAGLIRQGSDDQWYDCFRDRLIFPIMDSRGRPIGFGGRILGSGEPKYLNSPDGPVFDKGRTLFNQHAAAPASRKAGRLVIVEGYMDVLAFDRCGIADVVAPNGTALTEDQMALAWRMDPMPVICLDGDRAGRKAAFRAATRALPGLEPGRSFTFTFPAAGQDPDDLARERGPVAVRQLVDRPIALAQLLWDVEVALSDIASPDGRAALRGRLRAHVETITHPQVREEYGREFMRRIDALNRPERQSTERREERASRSAHRIKRGGVTDFARLGVLAGLLRFPEMIAPNVEPLAMIAFQDEPLDELRKALIEFAVEGGELESHLVGDIERTVDQVRRTRHLPYRFLRRDDVDAREALSGLIQGLAV